MNVRKAVLNSFYFRCRRCDISQKDPVSSWWNKIKHNITNQDAEMHLFLLSEQIIRQPELKGLKVLIRGQIISKLFKIGFYVGKKS